jgi:transposase-like protein
MESSKTTNKFSPEVRERAVRMVREHQGEYATQWAAISSIVAKIGCTAQTLSNWVRQAERDAGERAGLTSEERLSWPVVFKGGKNGAKTAKRTPTWTSPWEGRIEVLVGPMSRRHALMRRRLGPRYDALRPDAEATRWRI